MDHANFIKFGIGKNTIKVTDMDKNQILELDNFFLEYVIKEMENSFWDAIFKFLKRYKLNFEKEIHVDV